MKPATILSLVLMLGLVDARTASACSCVPPPPPAQALEQADAVFVGTAVAIEQEDDEMGGTYVVRFRVDRRVKGPDEQELILRTPGSSAACGYYFREGKQYLLYAHASDGQLHVNLCSRTARVADAQEDLRALGIDDLGEEAGSDLVGTSGRRCGGANNTAALQAVLFVLLGAVALRRRAVA